MNVTCSAEPCPILLNSSCVFYSGDNLIYTGIVTNDNLETALQKIDAKFGDAAIGYIFNNGLIQLAPGQPVTLGGSLIQNTTIASGGYNLTITGNLIAGAHITTGGTSSDFVKGDGSLDGTSYQPSGAYITALTGDGTATGPGTAAFTLSNTGVIANTYGSASQVPVFTVDSKGRITGVTNTAINYPAQLLLFSGDVTGAGSTGANVTLTLNSVNANVYGSNTALKFAVNAKGLVTSAAPLTNLDIFTIIGYTPLQDAPSNGTTYGRKNGAWTPVISGGGTVTSVSVTSGTGISASVTNPTTTPNITITNTAPDQTVVLNNGTGISVTGTYPNFTITNTSPSSGGTVTGTGTTNYLAKWTSASAIGNSLVYDSGTAVGIGTNSPLEFFHVYGGKSRFDGGNIIIGEKFIGVNESDSYELIFKGKGTAGVAQTGTIYLDGYGAAGQEAFVFSTPGYIKFNANYILVPTNISSSSNLDIYANSTTSGIALRNGYNQTSGNLLTVYNSGSTPAFSIDAATLNATVNSLSGVGTRMVVADASGVLGTQAIPSGGGGTVTSVAALTLGTTGTDLSSSVANSTTTPVITLNVPTASATNRGALSSSDWTTFNSKLSRLISAVSINTAAGSAANTDYIYLVSGTSTITLPTAVGNTNLYTIKRVGVNTVSVDTTSSQTIDGSSAPININVQYASLTLVSDGSNWNII